LCPEKFSGGDHNVKPFSATHTDNVITVTDAAFTVVDNGPSVGDTDLTVAGNGPVQPAGITQSTSQLEAQSTQSFLVAGEQVLLQTAIVPVRSSDGKKLINARVLLDSASKRTFMTAKLAQQLNLL